MVRAIDYGGMVFEDDRADTLAENRGHAVDRQTPCPDPAFNLAPRPKSGAGECFL